MKKLLAVILSAAMVLGMSATAFAADGVVGQPTLSVEGNVIDGVVTWDGSVAPTSVKKVSDCSIFADDNSYTGFLAGNIDGNQVLYAGAYAKEDGSAMAYVGHCFKIEFPETDEAFTVTLTDKGGATASVKVGGAAPTEEPPVTTEEPPVTDAPTTDAPATDAPTTNAPDNGNGNGAGGNGAGDAGNGSNGTGSNGTGATGTGSKGGATTTTTTGTGAGAGSAKTAKTADVAPVATMAVLALAAGVVVVSMKKKVTE